MTSQPQAERRPDPAAVMAVMTDVVSRVCAIEPDRIRPELRVVDLGIDSLFAAEILAQVERSLDVDIDVRTIMDDWSGLTLGDLCAQLWRGAAS